ncbi:hypothetical protein Vretimale_19713, partial [Volvox reticuliferus]
MAWVSCQTKLSYKYRRRTHTVTPSVEESYLRVDVSCASEACDSCRIGFGTSDVGAGAGAVSATPTSSLSASAPYYVIPDDVAFSDLLELFELPDISNYIILTSCLKKVSLKSGRKASRIRALYRDRRRCAVLFDDLHCLDTAAAAIGADPALPPALAAGLYYARHLGGRVPLVVVSDQLAGSMVAAAAAAAGGPTCSGGEAGSPGGVFGTRTGGAGGGNEFTPEDPCVYYSALTDNLAVAAAEGVTVLSAAEYVSRCWPPGSAVSELYDSLMAAKVAAAAAVQGEGDAAYRPHLSQQEVEEGLAAGLLMRGVLHVSRRNPREAVVELGRGPDSALGRLVRVSGRAAMNRAMEGDAVAVRLLLPGGPATLHGVDGGGGGGGGDAVATAAAGAEEDDPELDAEGAEATKQDMYGNRAGATATATAADQDADYGAELLADVGGPGGEGGEEGALAAMEAGSAGALPSAEVVAILHRDPRDIVVCLSQRDEAAIKARQEQQQQKQQGPAWGGGGGGEGGGGMQRRSEMLVCMPLDRRLPAVVVVTRQGHQLVGCRFVVRVDYWERSSRYPRGHVTRVLGRLNDLRAESDAVLVQCGINYKPFCEAALSELPRVTRPEDWRVPSRERSNRRDLTGPEYFVVSIDPVGCTDVDDAMHVRFLPPAPEPAPAGRHHQNTHVAGEGGTQDEAGERGEGAGEEGWQQRVEVGVHIADVSWFVAAGGMLDGEARDRCTSVYLVDRRLDMLPGLLSEQLCSLRQGVERLAVSVIWTLRRRRTQPQQQLGKLAARSNGDGAGGDGGVDAGREELEEYEYDVEDVWYGRTVIRSRHQLHYQQAQDILDGRAASLEDALPSEHVAALRRSLVVLDELTSQLHARRVAAGALELASAELRFQVDPSSGAPCQVECKHKVHMMDIVAEMMIAANSAVAERIATAFPGCALLRSHPPPRPQAFEEIRALLEPHSGGAQVDPTSNASLAAALERACATAAASDPAAATLIKSLATRAMSEAQYNSSGTTPPGTPLSYHYGLALQYYTHFTSPIRRYADVVVHRQLLAAISGAPPPQLHPDLAAAAAVMNMRHRQAKAAQKECSELYLLLLLHAQPHVEKALVCGITPTRLELFVPRYHLRGTVALTDRKGLPRPPLRPGQPDGHDAEEDPFLASERRGLRLMTTQEEVSITDTATGTIVWRVRLGQSVSVRLSAADHRAHGPKLALRVLDNGHSEPLPRANAQAQQPPAAAAAAAAAATAPPGGGAPALPLPLRMLVSLRDKAQAQSQPQSQGLQQQCAAAGPAAAARPAFGQSHSGVTSAQAHDGGEEGFGALAAAAAAAEPLRMPTPPSLERVGVHRLGLQGLQGHGPSRVGKEEEAAEVALGLAANSALGAPAAALVVAAADPLITVAASGAADDGVISAAAAAVMGGRGGEGRKGGIGAASMVALSSTWDGEG